jgi:hypothetical protein
LCFNDKFNADSIAFVNGRLVAASAKTMQSFEMPETAADAVTQAKLADPSSSERQVKTLAASSSHVAF